jgi:Flp pilus assembly protein TadG
VDCGKRLRALADETGQVIVFSLLAMVVLIAMVGFAVDVGHAYLVQRQLQAGVDAAALAGAQHLPEAAQTTQVAMEYGPSPGRKNAVTTVDNAQTTVTMKCLQGVPGCSSQFSTYNAVNVKATSEVKTLFARVIGFDTFTVNASATACSPCSAKDLDIMLVLDRTGSMCQKSNGSDDHPACTDLNNAKEGIRTFLSFMDPNLDRVGLSVFPPAYDTSSNVRCTTPTDSAGRYGYDRWWPNWISGPGDPSLYAVASLEDDYLVPNGQGGWDLASTSQSELIKMVGNSPQSPGCIQSAGTTAYANAIDEAQHELDTHGRGNVQDVIVFLSDGAANTTPNRVPSYVDTPAWRSRPCASGVEAARMAKLHGTIIYSIGYDLDGSGTQYEKCRQPNGQLEGGITADDAIGAIASEPENYYRKPTPGDLSNIFTRIAADLQRPAARLIDDGLQ